MSQRAAFLVETGSPIIVKERPIPSPSDTQVLVKISAAGVNPVNAAQRDEGYLANNLPTVIGSDGVGYVEKLGRKSKRFAVGDLILFHGNMAGGIDQATFQKYALADENQAAKIPKSLTAVQGATLPTTLATAFVGLFDESGANIKPPFEAPTVQPGSSIFVIGGSGSVGQAVIQLARIAGFQTIVTTASQKHNTLLTSLGATQILDRSTSAADVIKVAPNVKVVYDTISNANTLTLAVDVLAKQGGVIIRTHPYERRDLPTKIQVKYIYGSVHEKPVGAQFWRSVEKWLETGAIQPNRTLVFDGLEKVNDAVSKVKEGVSGVKVVVKID